MSDPNRRGPYMTTPVRVAPDVIAETVRLRRLGYPWEPAFELAELICAFSRVGFLAMVPEDFEQHLRP